MELELLYEQIEKVIKENKCEELESIVNMVPSVTMLHELSPERTNVISWISKDDLRGKRILEINCGCGATTHYLSQLAEHVTVVGFSKERNKINQLINHKMNNIEYLFYDRTTELNGFYDVVFVYNISEEDYDGDLICLYKSLFKQVYEHVQKSSRVYLTFDNKYGLQYWNGLGTAKGFFSVLSDTKSRHISMRDIDYLIKTCFPDSEMRFLYPYPNEKNARILFSDDRLPQKDELVKYFYDNFKYEDLNLLDEGNLWNNIIKEGQFPFFTNSYFVEVLFQEEKKDRVIYSKVSGDRADDFKIRTDIIKKIDGSLFVRKNALTSKSFSHINNIEMIEKNLQERYRNTKINIVESLVSKDGEYVDNLFVNGDTLESCIEMAISDGDYEKVKSYIDEYKELLLHGSEQKIFIPDDEFKTVFGEIGLEDEQFICNITDIDLNFDNILISKQWNVIDYEWTFDFPIPQKYVLYRAMVYWWRIANNRSVMSWDEWMKYLGISSLEEKEFIKMEREFQKYVSGQKNSFQILSKRFHNRVYSLDELVRSKDALLPVTVFYNLGEGFSGDNCEVFRWDTLRGYAEYNLKLPAGCQEIRIDPGEEECSVYLKVFDEKQEQIAPSAANARVCISDSYEFIEKDPKVIFTCASSNDTRVYKIVLDKYQSKESIMKVVENELYIKELEKEKALLLKKQEEEQRFRQGVEKELLLDEFEVKIVGNLDEEYLLSEETVFVRGWTTLISVKGCNPYLLLQDEVGQVWQSKEELKRFVRPDIVNVGLSRSLLTGFEGTCKINELSKNHKYRIGLRVLHESEEVKKDLWFESYLIL